MTLDQAAVGQSVRVESIAGSPDLVQRLMDLGLLEGDTVQVLALAPLGDPIEIQVHFTRLSLRRREAAGIHVSPL